MRVAWVTAAFCSALFFSCSGTSGSDTPGSEVEDADPSGGGSDKKDPSQPDEESNDKLDCSKIKSTGRELGDVAPDLVLEDGEGREVHLQNYCNDTVILIASEF